MHLVLIEDDQKIGNFVSKGLKQEGHTVHWARTGTDGLSAALEPGVDLVIVDVMLPVLDGLSVIRALRDAKKTVPTIVLSAKADVSDRIAGLDAGADDYLTKPFSFAELVARISALRRRAVGQANTELSLEYAGLSLDLRTRRVQRDGINIDLQTKEFMLLEYFMRNPNRVLSKTMILQHVWDYAFDPQTNVVDVLVSRLRAKIERNFPTKLIHTVRGMGYVLRQD